jgi:hypothetical protein
MNPEEDFLFYHHLGMGDHFILHGLVRRLYKEEEFNSFNLISKKHYANNVRFMYRDLEKIKIIEVNNDSNADQIFNSFKGRKKKHFATDYREFSNCFSEEAAYLSLGFEPSDRYTYFHLERDYPRENEVYNKIINFNDEYIFIADDASRGYGIEDGNALDGRKLKIIRSSDLLEYSIFDLIKIIKNAKDIHVIYSAFLMFLDCIKDSLPPMYIHESYIKKIYPYWPNDKNLKKFWKKRGIKIK